MSTGSDEILSTANLVDATDVAVEAAAKLRERAQRLRDETHTIVEGFAHSSEEPGAAPPSDPPQSDPLQPLAPPPADAG